MGTDTAETTDEAVATHAGENVWCPNGHGNRILEHDDPWPFQCPQCGFAMGAKPEPVAGSGKEVTLPTVGRIVYVRLSEEVTRPAIVMGRDVDGRCFVHIFRDDRDPRIPGLDQDSNIVVGYGSKLGTWHWPPQGGKAEKFEHFDD